MTSGASGGIWVRNWTDRVESRNICFQNCEFYKSGADELLAVWGWAARCGMSSSRAAASMRHRHRRGWMPIIARCDSSRWGQSGITDVRMEDCTVRAEYCETIFRMVGDKTRAVVDNCDTP